MNDRERFNATMAFEPIDRLPFMELMHYWPETLDRWYAEGLPNPVDPRQYFGYDRLDYVPVNFCFIPAFERVVLEEQEDRRIVRDESGVTKVEFKYGSAMPHYIDFPMKTRKDFLELKERLDPTDPARYPANWNEMVAAWKTRDYPLWANTRGFLAFERDFMQFTDMAMAVLTEPEWIDEMMDFHCDFLMRLWERMVKDVDVDLIVLGEDMAFKNGPMVSPAFVEEHMVPRYRKLTGFLKDHGVKNIFVDSDGDIRLLIPLYLKGGITGILPLEANSAMDPVAVRAQYPRLQMAGGLNKQIMALGGAAMRDEVNRVVRPLARTGGYLPSFDHSVHPATSLPVYKEYLETLRAAVRVD